MMQVKGNFNVSVSFFNLLLLIVGVNSAIVHYQQTSRVKRQAIESVVMRQCSDAMCQQQGSECREHNGEARCDCISNCNTIGHDVICGSDGETYFSRCLMDKSACERGVEINEVRCQSARNERLPEAVVPPENITATIGDTVIFQCKVSGFPKPLIYWMKRNTTVFLQSGHENGRINVESSNGTLVISRVVTSDSGTYVCLAINSLGKINLNFNLRVQDHPGYNKRCRVSPILQALRCPVRDRRPVRSYWVYNYMLNDCQQMDLRDCSAIFNKHRSKESCERTCGNKCDRPFITGPCLSIQKRFSFNPSTGQCESFIFGGCGGNGNNFHDVSSCRRNCAPNNPPTWKDCPFCNENFVKAYCRDDFVIAGRVKRITTITELNVKQIELHLTKVFKDGGMGWGFANLSDPDEAHLVIDLDVHSTCPCPDIPRILHDGSSARQTGEYYCRQNAETNTGTRRLNIGNSRCMEVILSGDFKSGIPTITQGNLATLSTAVKVARLREGRLCARHQELRLQET